MKDLQKYISLEKPKSINAPWYNAAGCRAIMLSRGCAGDAVVKYRMARIHDLPEDVRNKIAAGEVVERPASAVKELVENAVDAGSTRIEIEIVRGGRRLIRVSDNGTGMDRDDALRAAYRYTTSKVRSFEDLSTLSTYGFRGEALSSIAAVSRMRLISSLKDETCTQPSASVPSGAGEIGTCLDIVAGAIDQVRDCSSVGTTIEVRDLFFNTPARLKFLRAESTENFHIIDTVTRQALVNYSVAFNLVLDGRDVLSLPPALSCRERLAQIFGSQYAAELIEITESSRHMKVLIFLGRGHQARASRAHQYIFVNKRPVRDPSISHAVYRACEGTVPKERHPVFFVFLRLDPARIDVNVHPTKREVRFSDTVSVKDFIYGSASAALKMDFTQMLPHSVSGNDGLPSARGEERSRTEQDALTARAMQVDRVSEIADQSHYEGLPSVYLGDTFVAVASPEGLSIVDYHAAHERINYERFLKLGRDAVYRLLFPQQVRLDPAAYDVLVRNRPLLSSVGIDVEDFGHDCIIVRGLPEPLVDSNIEVLMGDVASSLSGAGNGEGGHEGIPASEASGSEIGRDVPPLDERRKAVAARLACHSSVRGRDIPAGPRLSNLLRDLDAADNPRQCPHGRPTRITFSLPQLRKMFRKE